MVASQSIPYEVLISSIVSESTTEDISVCTPWRSGFISFITGSTASLNIVFALALMCPSTIETRRRCEPVPASAKPFW